MKLIHPRDGMVFKLSVNLWNYTAGIGSEAKISAALLLPLFQIESLCDRVLYHLETPISIDA